MIRQMRIGDVPYVSAIICESLGYDTDTDIVRVQTEKVVSDSHYVSLVWEDGEGTVVGFIHAVEYETLHRGGGWDVISLAVAQRCQGIGVGSQLLRGFEELVRGRGATYVRLNSRVERTSAHAFYERQGYVSDKQQKRFIKAL